MFGERLDYLLLRPFVHSMNQLTKNDIERPSANQIAWDEDAARRRVGKLLERLEYPIEWDGLHLLDVGCGFGDLDVGLLLETNLRKVTGVEETSHRVRIARQWAQQAGVSDRAEFVASDIHDYEADEQFDIVLSHEALEHIQSPGLFVKRLASLVRPGGLVVLAFGPLFHSPFGDHQQEYFKVRIPWRGVLFNGRAVMRLRHEFYRETNRPDKEYAERMGLNLMRYSEFLGYISESNLEPVSVVLNPQLSRYPIVRSISSILTATSVVQDYFTMSVYAVLRAT